MHQTTGDDPVLNPPLFSRAALLAFALVASLVMIFGTLCWRDWQWTPTLPLPAVLLTLAIVLPVGEFIRHRFRLSLRAMLVLLMLLGIGLGLFGARWNKARLQRRAVQSVQLLASSGGYVDVSYDQSNDFGDDYVRTPGGWIVPTWLVNVLGEDFFFEVRNVAIQDVDLSDPGVFDGVELESFRELYFHGCKFATKTVERLALHRKLSDLSLCNCGITEEDLAKLAQLTNLTRLQIHNFPGYANPNQIAAVGLEEIAKLKSLTQLELRNLLLRSDALEPLSALSALEYLDLGNNGLINNDAARRSLNPYRT